MNLFPGGQTLQLVAWCLALVQCILALYVVLINVWHVANRLTGTLLFVMAASAFATGSLLGAAGAGPAAVPASILAATSLVVQPMLILVTVALLKPQWLRGERRRVWWVFHGLAALPILLTAMDVGLGTGLWYTGVDAEVYVGGFVSLAQFAGGRLSFLLRVVYLGVLPVLGVGPILYVALWDKKVLSFTRRLAWVLLLPQVVSLVARFVMDDLIGESGPTLVTNGSFAFVYAYAAFRQIVLERRLQRGRLQVRLIGLILIITIPLLVGSVFFVSARAGALIERDAEERLGVANRSLKTNVSTWLEFNVKVLQQLVSLPEVVSMDGGRQKPLLEATAAVYPHMYLVCVTDLEGGSVARSDGMAAQDYSDEAWFIKARDGTSLTFQSLVNEMTGRPGLAVSVPIRDGSGKIVGVGMFASDLGEVARQVKESQIGDTGLSFVVDAENRAVAHSDASVSAELRNLGSYPPVLALRQGSRREMSFVDEGGRRWLAYVDQLDNGWGIIVQLEEAEVRGTLRPLWQISWIVVVVGTVMLSALGWLTVRQTFLPIGSLTETVTAIAAGDLTRTAPVESEDELGFLARAFNSMTEQLRGLIGGLEQRVAERTADLEQRAVQLQVASEIARAATSELNLDVLLNEAANLLRERFGFYYVGLFLLDETGRWAKLRAGTGEAGRVMVEHGYRLEVGIASMVGWCVAYGQVRMARDAGDGAVRFDNPLLPDTRSEVALPLVGRGRVVGALDIQSVREGGFFEDEVTVLRTVADQIAVAIDNARLFAEVQESLAEAEAVQQYYLREAWTGFAATREVAGYRYAAGKVEADGEAWLPVMVDAQRRNQAIILPDEGGATTLGLPIKLRGETIGLLGLKKDEGGEWTEDDIAVAQGVADQVALSLENVRLFEEVQHRIWRVETSTQIGERIRGSVGVSPIIQTALEDLVVALGADRSFFKFVTEGGEDV